MDIIILIKTLFIGCFGAGGFYFVMSFVYHYFPLPLLIKMRDLLSAWGKKKHRDKALETDSAWVDTVWSLGSNILILFIIIAWVLTFALYVYYLQIALEHYIGMTEFFWIYFGIAVCMPSLWVLVHTIRFFRPVTKPVSLEEIKDDKSLLEQVAGD